MWMRAWGCCEASISSVHAHLVKTSPCMPCVIDRPSVFLAAPASTLLDQLSQLLVSGQPAQLALDNYMCTTACVLAALWHVAVQSVLLVELDGPRRRTVGLQVMGATAAAAAGGSGS
jgi:hypothetical protein